jgi:hypothetical protein
MKYKLANNQLVGEYQAFTYNEVQYPENWIALSTLQERQALGIQEFEEQQRPDDRFYFVTDNGDGTYSAVAKDLNDGDEYVDLRGVTRCVQGLKSTWSAQIKDTTNKLLAATDWMVIRKAERDVAIPAETVTYRAAVLAECDRLLVAISGATDVDALAAVVGAQQWPESA